jgi:acyl-CoA synthetase (AMP-forming)/AMP-acid ligase II
MSASDLLARPFGTLPDVIRAHALEIGSKPALIDPLEQLSYAELDASMDAIAAALQRDGVRPGDAVAICAGTSVRYAAAFLGALRAGATVAPLAPTLTDHSLALQLQDSRATVAFVDVATRRARTAAFGHVGCVVVLDGDAAGAAEDADGGDDGGGRDPIRLARWQAPAGTAPQPVPDDPARGFNIIYSSGTTGTPKGIVQPCAFRWPQMCLGVYPPDAVTIVSTPLYSNTTLVAFLPTIANGGTAVLMPKFDAELFLRLSERHRATHAMLVPVQYRRLLDHPAFDSYDLGSYRMKFCTSAPFAAELKAEVLRRWPGGLIEYYGMTEGGGSCALAAHERPDKLHTVGCPLPGHDVRVIDEAGRELPRGSTGEIVGRSPMMMLGYHGQPALTAAAEWWSPEGDRYIRTGDVGRFDDDGYVVLMDRRKDVIISGGFNVYPSDLEAVLAGHEDVAEAAVVGVPSARWGESPVAYLVLKNRASITAAALFDWANARLGKLQRLADVVIVDALPRSPIGKVLKRELRAAYRAPDAAVRSA